MKRLILGSSIIALAIPAATDAANEQPNFSQCSKIVTAGMASANNGESFHIDLTRNTIYVRTKNDTYVPTKDPEGITGVDSYATIKDTDIIINARTYPRISVSIAACNKEICIQDDNGILNTPPGELSYTVWSKPNKTTTSEVRNLLSLAHTAASGMKECIASNQKPSAEFHKKNLTMAAITRFTAN